jgi:hypothetical protein
MNSNISQKLLTGAMVLLVTVFVIPSFAGAFTQGQCRHEKGFGMKKHHMSPLGIWQNLKMVRNWDLPTSRSRDSRKRILPIVKSV